MLEREKQKQKLMILLHTSGWNIFSNPVSDNIEQIADYLTKNGVIVPPCKVGDTVYFIIDDEISGETYIDSQQINDVCTRGIFVSSSTLEENCDSFESYSNFGVTAFLTREKAEQALAERSGKQ